MPLVLHTKPDFDDFIKTCTPLARLPEFEAMMESRVQAINLALTAYQSSNDPVPNLARFLQSDDSFLGIILSMTNLSQEKFLRILSAERFASEDYGSEWGINQVMRKLKEDAFAEHIARLFIEGQNNPLLSNQVVDHVLPSLEDPQIMVMTSYMETTSSHQTARANEQREMYLKVQERNMRHTREKRVFVNFVDGAGWLARRSDLKKLYLSCDYIINLNTVDQLEAIICHHIPDQYIRNRPSVTLA